jgi:hypothetical protein
MIDTPCPFCREKDEEIARLKAVIEHKNEFMNKATLILSQVLDNLERAEGKDVKAN